MKARLSPDTISRLNMLREAVPEVRSYDDAIELSVLIATRTLTDGNDPRAERNRQRTEDWERKKKDPGLRRVADRPAAKQERAEPPATMAEVMERIERGEAPRGRPPVAQPDAEPPARYEHTPTAGTPEPKAKGGGK